MDPHFLDWRIGWNLGWKGRFEEAHPKGLVSDDPCIGRMPLIMCNVAFVVNPTTFHGAIVDGDFHNPHIVLGLA